MTSLPSSSSPKRSHSLLALLVAAVPLILASACSDKHIGRPCTIGLEPDPAKAQANPQSLECPSRICLLPAQEKTLDTRNGMLATGALCTDYCNSDEDCSDAETRGDEKTTSTRCLSGFACRTPIAGLQTISLSCKKLCVCKDFLRDDSTDTTPPGCKK
jgi:hypothetical protein